MHARHPACMRSIARMHARHIHCAENDLTGWRISIAVIPLALDPIVAPIVQLRSRFPRLRVRTCADSIASSLTAPCGHIQLTVDDPRDPRDPRDPHDPQDPQDPRDLLDLTARDAICTSDRPAPDPSLDPARDPPYLRSALDPACESRGRRPTCLMTGWCNSAALQPFLTSSGLV